MAKVIKFPVIFRDVPVGAGDDDDFRYKCMSALRMLFDNMQAGKVDPSKMFIVYGDNKTWSWSYLNLGFPPDALTMVVDLILEDQKENPD